MLTAMPSRTALQGHCTMDPVTDSLNEVATYECSWPLLFVRCENVMSVKLLSLCTDGSGPFRPAPGCSGVTESLRHKCIAREKLLLLLFIDTDQQGKK